MSTPRNERSWHAPMAGSWEIDRLRPYELHLGLAQAYAECSHQLCFAMAAGEIAQTFGHSRVVLTLAYHALELFYKGALLAAGEKELPETHRLDKLRSLYAKHYPERADSVPTLFRIENLCRPGEAEQGIEEKWRQWDQQYRYHTDLKGNMWPGVEGFEANSFLTELSALLKAFSVEIPILCRVGKEASS